MWRLSIFFESDHFGLTLAFYVDWFFYILLYKQENEQAF